MIDKTALWRPTQKQIERAHITRFMAYVGEAGDYRQLYKRSIADPESFWEALWQFAGVIGERGTGPVLVDGDDMVRARWFPRARLNFAENLLRRRDDGTAIIYRREDGLDRRLSYAELYAQVGALAHAFREQGLQPGDRVAAYLPNITEAVVAMLAVTSLGGVWSSCSSDFGLEGVLDRIEQIEPRFLIACDGYHYGGKFFDISDRVEAVADSLPTLEAVILIPTTESPATLDSSVACHTWDAFLESGQGRPPRFERLPFNHPLYILFSSGTTGAPKCIVHSAGGTLLQHLKEHLLHGDVRRDESIMYFTTLGWMMWNWLVSALACEATLVLFDGAPFHPGADALFDVADDIELVHFGTSAKYLDAVKKSGLQPRRSHKLSRLRTIYSTGSPLVEESFDFVYQHIKKDVRLSSISGGTDIVSCFVLGNPVLPVYRGEIQCRGLGMAVQVFDESGRAVVNERGELVCSKVFPSRPLGFWNDAGNERFRAAYFERFPGVWHQGDYCLITERGGVIMYGRSDAVLNPGGVRIGTAEIYRQVEQLEEVQESLAIGQDWDGDQRVVLFVRLAEGCTLSEELTTRIKQQIRSGASPRHVPAKVIQVADIPRTKSGKITELAVRDVVHGREVENVNALANPEALELFRELQELRS